ncbi:MAG TPA: cupredoxin domain-containing protein [Candidatus Limnocylindria bacterium]|nr:cupredoxin domain-containing protein [Candidatus Limnocylindria bacterium]
MKRIVLTVLGMALAASAASACVPADASTPLVVHIRIHYSKFEPAAIDVPAGVPVTFVIRNDDPIDHEWLIGDASFHARHRTGGEAAHGDRVDEVSLPSNATKSTTLTLSNGAHVFICHFPLHERYGMIGIVNAR